MKLIGSQSGIGIALSENITEKVMIPFVPSPFCNPDIAEHRRVEKCKDLINNPEFRAVGICQHRGCKGKKYYPHLINKINNNIVIQGQSTVRLVDSVRNIKGRSLGKSRGDFSVGKYQDIGD